MCKKPTHIHVINIQENHPISISTISFGHLNINFEDIRNRLIYLPKNLEFEPIVCNSSSLPSLVYMQYILLL